MTEKTPNKTKQQFVVYVEKNKEQELQKLETKSESDPQEVLPIGKIIQKSQTPNLTQTEFEKDTRTQKHQKFQKKKPGDRSYSAQLRNDEEIIKCNNPLRKKSNENSISKEKLLKLHENHDYEFFKVIAKFSEYFTEKDLPPSNTLKFTLDRNRCLFINQRGGSGMLRHPQPHREEAIPEWVHSDNDKNMKIENFEFKTFDKTRKSDKPKEEKKQYFDKKSIEKEEKTPKNNNSKEGVKEDDEEFYSNIDELVEEKIKMNQIAPEDEFQFEEGLLKPLSPVPEREEDLEKEEKPVWDNFNAHEIINSTKNLMNWADFDEKILPKQDKSLLFENYNGKNSGKKEEKPMRYDFNTFLNLAMPNIPIGNVSNNENSNNNFDNLTANYPDPYLQFFQPQPKPQPQPQPQSTSQNKNNPLFFNQMLNMETSPQNFIKSNPSPKIPENQINVSVVLNELEPALQNLYPKHKEYNSYPIFIQFTTKLTNFTLNDKVWYYKDPRGRTQGPFGSDEMDIWNSEKYFTQNLPISWLQNSEFVTIGFFIDHPISLIRLASKYNDNILIHLQITKHLVEKQLMQNPMPIETYFSNNFLIKNNLPSNYIEENKEENPINKIAEFFSNVNPNVIASDKNLIKQAKTLEEIERMQNIQNSPGTNINLNTLNFNNFNTNINNCNNFNFGQPPLLYSQLSADSGIKTNNFTPQMSNVNAIEQLNPFKMNIKRPSLENINMKNNNPQFKNQPPSSNYSANDLKAMLGLGNPEHEKEINFDKKTKKGININLEEFPNLS